MSSQRFFSWVITPVPAHTRQSAGPICLICEVPGPQVICIPFRGHSGHGILATLLFLSVFSSVGCHMIAAMPADLQRNAYTLIGNL